MAKIQETRVVSRLGVVCVRMLAALLPEVGTVRRSTVLKFALSGSALELVKISRSAHAMTLGADISLIVFFNFSDGGNLRRHDVQPLVGWLEGERIKLEASEPTVVLRAEPRQNGW